MVERIAASDAPHDEMSLRGVAERRACEPKSPTRALGASTAKRRPSSWMLASLSVTTKRTLAGLRVRQDKTIRNDAATQEAAGCAKRERRGSNPGFTPPRNRDPRQ